MPQAWRDRPKDVRFAIVGALVGMLIAGIVAYNFAFDADTIVRYLIMSAGLLIGLGVGKWIGSRPPG